VSWDSEPEGRQVGGSKGGKVKAKPRFSLFAAPQAEFHESAGEDEGDEEDVEQEEGLKRSAQSGSGVENDDEEDQTIHGIPPQYDAPLRQPSSAEREEKLRESLYELRQMNDVFEGFLGALEAARGHNEVCRVSVYH
jgi:hypothetical protein